jgi:Thaumatin family
LSCPGRCFVTAVSPDGLQMCCESAFLSHVRLRASWVGSQCPQDDLNIDVKIGIFAGSNLPMFINVTHGTAANRVSRKGCVPAGCTTPVNCPGVLRVKAAGSVVGCESACARFGTDQYCCRAQWAPRAACNPAQWPVDYAAVFKKAEPYAYSYADDDATSTYVCKGRCDYRITFGLTPTG